MSRWILAALLGFCLAVGTVALVRSAPPVDLKPRKVVLMEKDHTILECLGGTCTAVGLDRWYHLWWDIPANRSNERVAYALKRPDGSTQTTYNRRPGAPAITFSAGWRLPTKHPMFMFAHGVQMRANEMPEHRWSGTGTLRLPSRGKWYVMAWIDYCFSSPCPKGVHITHDW